MRTLRRLSRTQRVAHPKVRQPSEPNAVAVLPHVKIGGNIAMGPIEGGDIPRSSRREKGSDETEEFIQPL